MTKRSYEDIDSNQISLLDLCKQSPQWATNRIERMEQIIEEKQSLYIELKNWKTHAKPVIDSAKLYTDNKFIRCASANTGETTCRSIDCVFCKLETFEKQTKKDQKMSSYDLVKLAKQNVSNAKRRLTKAKNKGHNLKVLIDLNRDVTLAKSFELRIFQYQHTLEDSGISTLDEACSYLRQRNITWN